MWEDIDIQIFQIIRIFFQEHYRSAMCPSLFRFLWGLKNQPTLYKINGIVVSEMYQIRPKWIQQDGCIY